MLEHISEIRNKLSNAKTIPFGFEGDFFVESEYELKLLNKIPKNSIRELFRIENSKPSDIKEVSINDKIHLAIDTSRFNGYYETLSDFINANKYKEPNNDFYIHELNYLDSKNISNVTIKNYKIIVSIIDFLDKIATHSNIIRGIKELIFQKPDKICVIRIEYTFEILNNLNCKTSLEEIKPHVLDHSDKETRMKLFNSELINILINNDINFQSIIKHWDKIVSSYRTSFSLYLSEFSFEKIKTSSQEYFHELTDRIYSTIHKFSTYILAIPIAYIFIIRFFDFAGESLPKDSFLLIVGFLYFLVIWFVLLNNLSKAFETIESDIKRFLERISNEESLYEIINDLNNQKDNLIPNQKRRIIAVRIISILILILTFSAFIYIHFDFLKELIEKNQIH